VEYGKRLVDVDQSRRGVTARFADGSVAHADVLVGADGIRSTVRALIDAAAPQPRYVGRLGFGGFSSASVAGARPDAMYFVFGKRAFMGHWSAPGGGTAWFSNLPHPEPLTMAEARRVPNAEWMRRLREVYAEDTPGRELIEHTELEQLLAFGAGEMLPSVPHWSRGRVVLVGDSAHAPSSSSGQGASLAVESAIQLARCLRDFPDARAAFVAYERLRRPRVEKIAAQAAKTNNDKTAGPLARALMSIVMPIAMRTFMKPRRCSAGCTATVSIGTSRSPAAPGRSGGTAVAPTMAMATRAEAARYESERAKPKKRKRPQERPDHERVQQRVQAEVDRYTSGHPARGATARRNVKVDRGDHVTFALEDSGTGRPSRKSTRKTEHGAKPDSPLRRREMRRTRSPRARHARA